MKKFTLALALLCLSAGASDTNIEDIIRENVGTVEGKQEKDGLRCKFTVSEKTVHGYSLSITFQNPERVRAIFYPGLGDLLSLDAISGRLVFDKSGVGKPNLVYLFDTATLKMLSVEEEGHDFCTF